MYRKLFFENFWSGEQKNELFVSMSFDFDEKFKKIEECGKNVGFQNVTWTKGTLGAKEISTKILDNVAHSKVLLFDLSDDPKKHGQSCLEKINENVIYELGIATSIRAEEDILLIREGDAIKPEELPFDIRDLSINPYGEKLENYWLEPILKKFLDEQDWYRGKRIEIASKSIDGEGIELMYLHGRCPKGYNHFGSKGMETGHKISALRLLDLGILRTEWGCYRKGFEYAYHWTPFGYAVMKHLGIEELSMDEFEEMPEYEEHQKFLVGYREFKRRVSEK